MKILVIGSGGREHGLVWAARRSVGVKEVVAAPGNAGIEQIARCAPVAADDIEGLVKLARQERPHLVLIGPEVPLTLGLTDRLRAVNITAFGPSAAAARLEGSKSFAKEFMSRHNIPTARFATCRNLEEALQALDQFGQPVVVKADGLAAGKGVTVAATRAEAEQAVRQAMQDRVFGEAGDLVVIEECLQGEEASILAFADGKTVVPLLAAQDHKRIGEGDQGPNTGGMGAYAPAPVITKALQDQIQKDILEPVIAGMNLDQTPYRGILYAGLMITPDGPKVIEFNCRFGDPETQVVLPLLDSDLVALAKACVLGRLNPGLVSAKAGAAVCVVLAAPGYPGKYPKGLRITGIESAEELENVMVWHAGTIIQNGQLVSSGGRVLNVIAQASTLREAVERVYQAVGKIRFEGIHFRRDIAYRALRQEEKVTE